MANEPLYNVIKADYKKKIGASQVVVECRLVPDANVQIRKVLSIACCESVQACELLAGEARVSGRVNFKVLFTDTEEGLHCMDYNADFSEKVISDAIQPGLAAEPSCGILDTDTVSVSSGEIKLACVVELNLFSVVAEEITTLESAGEEVFTLKESLEFRQAAGSADAPLFLSFSEVLKREADRVLMCDADVVLTHAEAGLDSLTVKGRAAVNAILCGEDSLPFSCRYNFDFEESVAAAGVLPEQSVHADLEFKSVAARLEKDLESGNDSVSFELQVLCRATAYVSAEAETVTDAFSVKNELLISGESYSFQNYLFSQAFEEKIEGSASLGADMPYMDSVLALCATRINIANVYAEKDSLRLEGLINAGVVYAGGEGGSASVQVELPYSLTLPMAGVGEDCVLTARGMISELSARPKKGTELDISAKACFYVSVYREKIGYCIKEIEAGAQRSAPMSAIAVYITKEGESLWEVAKALCTTPELIMSFNPALALPLKGNERILVYRQN